LDSFCFHDQRSAGFSIANIFDGRIAFFFWGFFTQKKKIGTDTSVMAHPCVVVHVQQKSFAGVSKLAKADKRTPKPTNKASGASLAAGQKRANSKPATKSKEAVNSGRGCGRPGAASRGSGAVPSRARAKAKQFSDRAHGSDTSGWVRISRHISMGCVCVDIYIWGAYDIYVWGAYV